MSPPADLYAPSSYAILKLYVHYQEGGGAGDVSIEQVASCSVHSAAQCSRAGPGLSKALPVTAIYSGRSQFELACEG